MAHTCPICSEPCYCMGDYDELVTGQPAYCRHCTEFNMTMDEIDIEMDNDHEEI